MKILRTGLLVLLSLIIVAIVIAYIYYVRSNVEVKTLSDAERKSVTGSFIQLPDGVTHYELSGPDTGKLIVLAHGFSVPYYIWDSTAPALAQQGFRVLRFDAFGRGYSDRPDKVYEASLYRKQLYDLLEKLNIHSIYAIAGVSFGGPVVTDFTIHYPQLVNKVILVDPAYPWDAHLSYPELVARYQRATTPEDVANGQLTDLKYPQQFPHWVEQYKVQMQYKGFTNALVSTRYHYAPEGMVRANYKALDSLQKPVLLIWGKEDETVPYKFSDSLLQILHCEFLPVDDAKHLPQMEKPVLVNEKIGLFLKRREIMIRF